MTKSLHPDSQPLVVDMDIIRAYAELTEDFNPLHLDSEFAEKTAMKGVIAHGTMSLGLLIRQVFESQVPEGAELELDVRFVGPVRVGDTPRVQIGDADDSDMHHVSVHGADEREYIKGTLRIK